MKLCYIDTNPESKFLPLTYYHHSHRPPSFHCLLQSGLPFSPNSPNLPHRNQLGSTEYNISPLPSSRNSSRFHV